MKFISQSQLEKAIDQLPNGEYREYLRMVNKEQSVVPKPVG